MYVFSARKAALAMTILACLAASGSLFATTLPNVIYTASGTFSSTPVSGNDLFELAGNPFKIYITANEGTRPHTTGKGYATYVDLRMKGSVTSGLSPTPIPIQSTHTFFVLAIGVDQDTIEIQAPVEVLQKSITISAKFVLPKGILTKYTIWQFSGPATLTPSSGPVSYSNSGATTVLTVATGSLVTHRVRATVTSAAVFESMPALFGWSADAVESKYRVWS
jgi:hypothetical protein